MAAFGPQDLEGRADGLSRTLHTDDRWLRDLARRLLRDPSLADDAAQQTWLSVLRSPPRDGMNRGFLATALRNVISKLRRGDGRREARERLVAADGGGEAIGAGLGSVVEQLELRREILAAVLDLDAAYRDVILLRFYEDLKVSEIAAKHGVPIATVKTRLRRAEERLASVLDARNGGDRRRYLPALIATARPGWRDLAAAFPTMIAGGIVVGMKSKIVVAGIVVLAAIGGFALFESGSRPESSPIAAPGSNEPSVAPDAPRVADSPDITATSPAREEARPTPVPSATGAAEATETRHVEGIVFDESGRPLRGAALEFVADAKPGKSVPTDGAAEDGAANDGATKSATAAPLPTIAANGVSDAAGRFEFDVPLAASGRVRGASRGVATLFEGVVQARRQEVPPVVVLTASVELAGEVVDPEGRPIAGATLGVAHPPELRRSIPAALENASPVRVEAKADAAGRFTIARAPSFAVAKLFANAESFVSISLAVPTADDHALRVVLERPSPEDPARVRGQVVDAFGAPVAAADVVLGTTACRTDDRGLFDLDATKAENASVLRAVAKGAQPGEIDWPLDPPRPFVVLALGPPALSIRGIVRRADGSPAKNMLVQCGDGTALGFVAGPINLLKMVEEQCGDFDQGVQTDAAGAFELPGLSVRSYVLRIFDTHTGAALRTASIAAGSTGVIVDLPANLTHASIKGRVVDRSGAAVPGVDVSINATRFECVYLGGNYASTSGFGRVQTDAEGRFRLVDVPRFEARIEVGGDSILSRSMKVPAEPPAELEIVVDRKRFLRIELAENDPADSFAVVDANGRQLILIQEEEGSIESSNGFGLTKGRSGVITLGADAKTVVLYREERELRRIPLEFAAEGVTIVR